MDIKLHTMYYFEKYFLITVISFVSLSRFHLSIPSSRWKLGVTPFHWLKMRLTYSVIRLLFTDELETASLNTLFADYFEIAHFGMYVLN